MWRRGLLRSSVLLGQRQPTLTKIAKITRATPLVLMLRLSTNAHTVEALDQQAKSILSHAPSSSSERQALTIIQKCTALCEQDSTHTRELCIIADRLAQHAVARNTANTGIFTAYLDLYAHLGRPDVVQHAIKRESLEWSRLPMHMYAVQQLALLRFRANAGLLARTDASNDAARVETRLLNPTVQSMVDTQTRRERMLRWVTRLYVFSFSAAFTWLGWKWIQVGTRSFAPPGSGLMWYTACVAASVAMGVVCARLVMKYSIAGQLSAHDNSAAVWARKLRTGSAELSRADEKHVLRLLWRAFPAGPYDHAVDEINAVLARVPGELPRMRWRMRAALQWALFARRLGPIDVPLLGDHGVRQRLAVLWLRGLPHMFAPGEHRAVAAATPLVAEFTRYVDTHFARVPLALAPSEAQELSRFVATTSTDALGAWLRVVVRGRVAVDPQRARDDAGAEILSFRRSADEVLLFAEPADIARFRAAACATVFTTLLGALSRSPRHSAEMLDLTLRELISARVQLSPSLFPAALAAARALDSPAMARRLIETAEKPDSFVYRMSLPPASAGWRLPGESTQLPIIACIGPYVHWLAQASPGDLAPFIERWLRLRILTAESAVQCLDSAITSCASQAKSSSEWVAGWAELACSLVHVQPTQSDAVSRSLSQAAAHALELCWTPDHKLRVFTAWSSVARIQSVRDAASPQLTLQIFMLLTQLAESDSRHHATDRLHMALACLDHMRVLGHVPPADLFARMCRAAARLKVNVAPYVDYWAAVIQKKSKSAKLDSFARSLQ
ncbi:hypothetical protein IWW50_003148 [Coemansia erecta]|nr:hypothetical protein IWW50_003148 [Coemansia erecta]